MKDNLIVIGSIAVIAAGCLYFIGSREIDRPGKEVVAAAQSRLDDATLKLNQARERPELPLLAKTWAEMDVLLSGCGLTAQVKTGEPGPLDYAGPTNFWTGTVQGNDMAVTACMYIAVKEMPVLLNSIAVGAGTATISYSVLGSVGNKS